MRSIQLLEWLAYYGTSALIHSVIGMLAFIMPSTKHDNKRQQWAGYAIGLAVMWPITIVSNIYAKEYLGSVVAIPFLGWIVPLIPGVIAAIIVVLGYHQWRDGK
jgi:hypothetical protein